MKIVGIQKPFSISADTDVVVLIEIHNCIKQIVLTKEQNRQLLGFIGGVLYKGKHIIISTQPLPSLSFTRPKLENN